MHSDNDHEQRRAAKEIGVVVKFRSQTAKRFNLGCGQQPNAISDEQEFEGETQRNPTVNTVPSNFPQRNQADVPYPDLIFTLEP